MGARDVEDLSTMHTALMNAKIAQPTISNTELAELFNVTPQWVSVIVNSNAFKTRVRELQDKMTVDLTLTIHDRLAAVATDALTRVHEHVLANEAGPQYCLDVADKTLHRLGYAPQRGTVIEANTQINNTTFSVSQDDLARARALMGMNDVLTLEADKQCAVLQNTDELYCEGSVGSNILPNSAPVYRDE